MPAQVQEKFDAGDYRGTLKAIAGVLSSGAGADRAAGNYPLFMMKAECLLQLNSAAYAADAFEDAGEASDDQPKATLAKASELVIRKSPSLKYIPKSGADRSAIDVKSPESRTKAMLALRADLLAQNKARLEKAGEAGNLEPLLKLLPVLREVALLELGATGELQQSRPMLVNLGTHARELITQELKLSRARVEALNATASEISFYDDIGGRRGLHTSERKDLAAMADYVRQIEATGREGRRIARLLGGAVDAWERIVTDSNDLTIRIDTMLRRAD